VVREHVNHHNMEIPSDIDVGLRWNLFKKAFYSHWFHIAYGHPVLARNDEALPRAGVATARGLREGSGAIKGFAETWGNPAYCARLAVQRQCLEGPNEFMGLGPALLDAISFPACARTTRQPKRTSPSTIG
jgi:hypothetical protein